MRGARRLGALFLFVASLVVASEHDDLTNSMINNGFTATVDRDGNPIYVKMMAMEMAMGESGTIFDAPAVDVDAKTLEDIDFARKWLSLVTLPDPRGDSPMALTIGEAKLTPLHVASMHGLVEEARALLELDVDIDATDKNERTALHHAAIMGHLDVVELLLEWDADVDAIDENFSSPLHVAAMIGEADVVQYLLKAGADIEAINDRGWSPLLEAVIQDEGLGVAQILLEAGADVNVVVNDGTGRTPLHGAAQVKNVEMAQLLLSFGANVEPNPSSDFVFPLRIAILKKDPAMCKLFIDAGATVTEIDLKKAEDDATKVILMDELQLLAADEGHQNTRSDVAGHRDAPRDDARKPGKMCARARAAR